MVVTETYVDTECESRLPQDDADELRRSEVDREVQRPDSDYEDGVCSRCSFRHKMYVQRCVLS